MTYFSVAWKSYRCGSQTEPDGYLQSGSGLWPNACFCLTTNNFKMKNPLNNGYSVKVLLKHVVGAPSKRSHLGIAFNMRNQNNYEILYLR